MAANEVLLWPLQLSSAPFPLLLLLLFFCSLPLPSLQAPQDFLPLVYSNCSLRNTASLSPTFSRNLNTALRNLSALASQGTTYSATTAGTSGQDMVYAAFQCRGDLSTQSCSVCMQNATARLPHDDCPAYVSARIELDGCFLRYGNQSFFVLDTSIVVGLCNVRNTNNMTTLTAIKEAMENVTSQAPRQGGFADSSSSGVYAVAQCLGYLNESECSQCLSMYSYREFCNASVGKRLYLGSCFYRYELYDFLDAPQPPAPSSSPSPLPAPPSPSPSSGPLPAPPLSLSLPPPLSRSHGWKASIAAVNVIVEVSIGIVAILV